MLVEDVLEVVVFVKWEQGIPSEKATRRPAGEEHSQQREWLCKGPEVGWPGFFRNFQEIIMTAKERVGEGGRGAGDPEQ